MKDLDFSVFTVCNIAYLPKALVLADSLNKYHGKRLNVVLFDRKQDLSYPMDKINALWVSELGLPQWQQFAFMYDIIEFSTSLKPFIALKFLETNDKVIFLDPDIALYSNLESVLQDLDQSPVLLTPHYIKPQPSTAYESDLPMMRFGSFNLGFFAVKGGEQASEFLTWWNRRCLDFSFMESQFGLSTDQKWVSIAPCFFDFLKISFNPGYNAAAWNTFERTIQRKQDCEYWVNDKYRLVFFHFSNFDHEDPQYLLKRASSEMGVSYPCLEELGRDYSKHLSQYESVMGKIPYTYDFMSDGSYISPTLRRAYASIREKLPANHDPFDSNGVVGEFARKNYLLSRSGIGQYKYPGLKVAKSFKLELALVYRLLRAMLWLVGPNRFYDISKLMVYLSLFRMDHKYWKLSEDGTLSRKGRK